jgi:hypothetical protein
MLKELTRKPTRVFETDCANQGMIDHVAKANQLGLPHAEYFNALFAEGGDSMQDVDRVAEFLWTLLHVCPAEEFGSKEWCGQTPFLRHFVLKMLSSPRRALDKHVVKFEKTGVLRRSVNETTAWWGGSDRAHL